MCYLEYRVTPSLEGWRIASLADGEPVLAVVKAYLTQPAAVHNALNMASQAARDGHHARVVVDGEDGPLVDFEPKT